jgi:signal peptidase
MKVVRIIYNIIAISLTASIILLTLLAMLLGISGMDRQNPKSVFGLRAFIVLTPSMTPTFDAGSLIIIKEVNADKLQIGDIITYTPKKGDDVLLTHRIVKMSEETKNRTSNENLSFITRGDANNTDDPNPVDPNSILGKTIFHMNGLGTFIVNLRTPLGIAAMVGIIAVGLFIIPYMLNPGEENTKQENTEENKQENKEEENKKKDNKKKETKKKATRTING